MPTKYINRKSYKEIKREGVYFEKSFFKNQKQYTCCGVNII